MTLAPIDQPFGPLTIGDFPGNRIRIYRRFAAPRETLFDAIFQADSARKWLGGDSYPIRECSIAAHPGGQAHYVWDLPSGKVLAITATFSEVARPARTVHCETRDDDADQGSVLCTQLLIPVEGGTLLTTEFWYGDAQTRDAMLAGPMAARMEENYARLDALLSA